MDDLQDELLAMKVGQRDLIGSDQWMCRVPGGWVFTTYDSKRDRMSSSCFVPEPGKQVVKVKDHLMRALEIFLMTRQDLDNRANDTEVNRELIKNVSNSEKMRFRELLQAYTDQVGE